MISLPDKCTTNALYLVLEDSQPGLYIHDIGPYRIASSTDAVRSEGKLHRYVMSRRGIRRDFYRVKLHIHFFLSLFFFG
jgi:hypothetical protein